jgi:uncharacterized protein YbjT (DUF2867 family)
MNVLIFGATGMVGQGALRECLLDPEVTTVRTIGRSPSGVQHQKLRDIVHQDLLDYSAIEADLSNFDACFFCLGVASSGMTEEAYTRVTYGITIAAAGTLSRLNPDMTFIFVSGAGADSSEKGATMWARVKGKAENAVLRLPFKASYVFRPAAIQPFHGIKSRTALYRVLYSITGPLIPLLRSIFPGFVTTTEELGRAMILVARNGAPKRILESRDIVEIVAGE